MLKLIGLYLPYIYTILLLVAAFRLGDWRNWNKYYSTILFIITLNFLSSILTYEYSLWLFKPTFMVPNHTIADIMIKFTNFPAIILIYLTQYPYQSRWLSQFAYIVIWTIIWTLVEYSFLLTKMMTYHHGWNIGFSFLLWLVMFVTFRLHHTRKPWAWFLCLGFGIFVILYFKIPITKMK